jgi:hypothetical protein
MSEGARTQKAIVPTFTPVNSGILRRAAVNAAPEQALPAVHKAVVSPKSSTHTVMRAFREPHFEHDFTQVRLYTRCAVIRQETGYE